MTLLNHQNLQETEETDPPPPREKIIIKLAEGKELSIKSMSTSLFYFHGKPVSAEEFIKKVI
jgi:type I restriction enzyme R subunit